MPSFQQIDLYIVSMKLNLSILCSSSNQQYSQIFLIMFSILRSMKQLQEITKSIELNQYIQIIKNKNLFENKQKQSKTMTFVLNITKIKGPQSKGFLYIEGSQGGMYKVASNYTKADQRRTLYCSKNDKLRFMFCKKSDTIEPVNILGENTHYFSYLSERLQRQKSSKQVEMEYQIDLYDQQHKKVGKVEMELKYQRGLDYMGLVPISFFKKNALQSFYFGKCPTKNLFNFLDEGMKKFEMNWFQNIYRDENRY